MTPVITKLVLIGFLVPAAVVFTIAYKYALRHWLRPAGPLPTAAIAGGRARFRLAAGARHFHAAAIATAFASVSIMGLSALAVIGVIIASAIRG